jgi:hypothetical protein
MLAEAALEPAPAEHWESHCERLPTLAASLPIFRNGHALHWQNDCPSVTTKEGCWEIAITQGNINNNHFYLTKVIKFFPEDVIGGPNKKQQARQVRLHWGNETIQTDVDGTKHIFRRRGWIGKFFKDNCTVAGDRIILTRIDSHTYRVEKEK